MYLNSFGGSGLLHILAGHPRLVAGFGLVGAVALLASPVGPGTYRGTAKYATSIERVIHDRGSEQVMNSFTNDWMIIHNQNTYICHCLYSLVS